jgi:3',5'-cyclic AMP phosphodiesterase CpdA
VNLPWSHESFDVGGDKFTFAIFSDLYGGERAGVFDVAVAQLNLLRPELVLSVGDLIDGGTEDLDVLQQQWTNFDKKIAKLKAPVLPVGGNHDLTNLVMRNFWVKRYGARYYYFVYKNVLFLMLDSEDYSEDRMAEIFEARSRSTYGDRDSEYGQMQERLIGAIGSEQAEYFRSVLAANADVRWTFLLMHKPVWRNPGAVDFDSIEDALVDRPYTVVNGHFHAYSLVERRNRDYITLATTSGGQNPKSSMVFDHVMLVTIAEDAPSIVNLRLDGILNKSGTIPLNGGDLCFQASICSSRE